MLSLVENGLPRVMVYLGRELQYLDIIGKLSNILLAQKACMHQLTQTTGHC